MVGQKFSQRTPFAVVPPWFVLVKTLATNLAFDGVGRVGVGTDVAFVLGRGLVSSTFRAVVTLVTGGGCGKKEEGTKGKGGVEWTNHVQREQVSCTCIRETITQNNN